jgi:hypothetical protein
MPSFLNSLTNYSHAHYWQFIVNSNHVNIRVAHILVDVLNTFSSNLWNGECSGNLDYLFEGSIESGGADPIAIKHDGLRSEN